MTKFCSALLYLENLLTNIFAKLNLRGGVSCMPAALLFVNMKSQLIHLLQINFNRIMHIFFTSPISHLENPVVNILRSKRKCTLFDCP